MNAALLQNLHFAGRCYITYSALWVAGIKSTPQRIKVYPRYSFILTR